MSCSTEIWVYVTMLLRVQPHVRVLAAQRKILMTRKGVAIGSGNGDRQKISTRHSDDGSGWRETCEGAADEENGAY